ncbi:hypothetical protein ASPCAL07529 [Aspergillus calidoustus]|uniref:Uncharacterized protein n=1 Tax=Aspergillus calidoustus TaxID=454130 RepID=A0A0U4ZXX9_ASPCI|nr:hypothetical protein ASPCAL07529 [Aspergillus calidoustus]
MLLPGRNSWAQEICSDDNEERALVVATMNTMSHVFQAWLPQIVWQQVDAPKYRSGFICCAAMAVGLLCMVGVVRWKHNGTGHGDKSSVMVDGLDRETGNADKSAQ